MAPGVDRIEPGCPVVRDDVTSVSVAEEDVVELRQEPDRGGGVRIGSWRVGQVEQLAAGLAAKRRQLGPQPVDHGGTPRQSGPLLKVGDAGRAERAQVAHDHVVHGDRRLSVAPGPGLELRVLGLARLAPEAARRDLHEGEPDVDRVADRLTVAVDAMVGDHAGGEFPASQGLGRVGEHVAGGGDGGIDVNPLDPLAPRPLE